MSDEENLVESRRRSERKYGMDWDIDRNLPVHTDDLLRIAKYWMPYGKHTLAEIIETFAEELAKLLHEQTGD